MKKLILAAVSLLTATHLFAENYAIDITPGKIVKTYGWADMANDGKGIAYPDTDNIIVIDDKSYPDPIKKRRAFTSAIASGKCSKTDKPIVNDKAAIIILSGTVDLSDGKISDEDHSYFDEYDSKTHKRKHDHFTYYIGANKAIIGVNSARIAFGELQINGVQGKPKLAKNVIIQNVEFWDGHGSTEYDTKAPGSYTKNGKQYLYKDSQVQSNNLGIGYGNSASGRADPPENIWIDHCKFSDGTCDDMALGDNHDGSLDIPVGHHITISYCEFTNHDKVMLVGKNEEALNPDDRQVTLHHNYFHKTTQRTPRSRGCYMHIYNCFYDEIGVPKNPGYCLGPGTNSLYIVENNYFGSSQKEKIDFYDMTKNKKPTLRLYTEGNNIEFTDSDMSLKGTKNFSYSDYLVSEKPWQIPYDYSMEDANDLNNSIPKRAGVDKEDYTAIRVNGVVYSK